MTIPKELLDLKDGPQKKFYLIKQFGAALREKLGYDPRMLGCDRLVREIQNLAK